MRSRGWIVARDPLAQFRRVTGPAFHPMFRPWFAEVRVYALCGCFRSYYQREERFGEVRMCERHAAEHRVAVAQRTPRGPQQAGPTVTRGAFGDRGNE